MENQLQSHTLQWKALYLSNYMLPKYPSFIHHLNWTSGYNTNMILYTEPSYELSIPDYKSYPLLRAFQRCRAGQFLRPVPRPRASKIIHFNALIKVVMRRVILIQSLMRSHTYLLMSHAKNTWSSVSSSLLQRSHIPVVSRKVMQCSL